MALIKCPECNKEISDKAKLCPNCGYEQNQQTISSKQSDKKGGRIGCGTWFIVIVIILFIFYLLGSPDDNTKRTSLTNHEAKIVAEGQVETMLKSPSTAKFSGLSETEFEPIKNGFKVTGYVDSQNGFGAMIRSSYSVEIFVNDENGQIMYKNLKVK